MRPGVEGPFEIEDRKRDLNVGFTSGGNHHPGVRELAQTYKSGEYRLEMKLEMRLESGQSEEEQQLVVEYLANGWQT